MLFKAGLYSGTRTIVREGADDVLKSIPGIGATAGVALDFLEKYGKNVQANYEVTGNIVAAQEYAAGNAVLDGATGMVTSAIPGSGFGANVVRSFVRGEISSGGKEYLKVATGMQTEEQAKKNFANSQAGIITNSLISNVDIDTHLTDNNKVNSFVNTLTNSGASRLASEVIKAEQTGDLRSLDFGKMAKDSIIDSTSRVVTDTVSDSINRENIAKEIELGYIYQDEDGNYMKKNLVGGEDTLIKDINTYKSDIGLNEKPIANVAGTVFKNGTNQAISTIEKTVESAHADSSSTDEVDVIDNLASTMKQMENSYFNEEEDYLYGEQIDTNRLKSDNDADEKI